LPETTGGAPLLALFEKWLSPRLRGGIFHHHWVVRAVTAPTSLRDYPVGHAPRSKTYYGGGDLHFITCSCYQRQPLLGAAHRRDLFLTVLSYSANRT